MSSFGRTPVVVLGRIADCSGADRRAERVDLYTRLCTYQCPLADSRTNLVFCSGNADAEIEAAARAIRGSAALLGHTSGATPLAALGGPERFGLHPLQTIATPDADLRGAGCAVAGSSERALEVAAELARALGMEPFEIADEQRAAYHAAASIASNFLLTLASAAESVAGGAGIPPERARRLLGPLVQATVANWLAAGPAAALTGPVARGDAATVERQREAVARAAPDELELFDALVARTRALAGRVEAVAA